MASTRTFTALTLIAVYAGYCCYRAIYFTSAWDSSSQSTAYIFINVGNTNSVDFEIFMRTRHFLIHDFISYSDVSRYVIAIGLASPKNTITSAVRLPTQVRNFFTYRRYFTWLTALLLLSGNVKPNPGPAMLCNNRTFKAVFNIQCQFQL
jgi:hypothetical protein